MPEPTPTRPRWRLDAVALTLLAGCAVVTGCVLTYPPLTGGESLIGPAGDDVAAYLVNSLGVGVVGLVAGWVTVVGLYIVRRRWRWIAMRAGGWVVLTVAGATAADFTAGLAGPPASAFGRGGAVGAYLRFVLDDNLKSPLPGVIVAIALAAGVALVADGLLRRLARWAVHGNTIVARAGDRAIAGGAVVGRGAWRVVGRLLTRPKREVVPLAAVPAPAETETIPSDPPITRHAEADPEPDAVEPDVVAADEPPAEADPVPITRPAALSDTPAPVKALERFDAAPLDPVEADYDLPPLSLLADPDPFPVEDHEQKLRDRAAILEKTFTDFGLNVKVVGIHTGPVITQYEVALDTGMRLNKVTTLSDDLALCLGVPSVRIVAPLPGRTTVGIEVPNDHRQTVRLKELAVATTAKAAKFKLPLFLGKDVEGRPLVYDMATMPHLLIAGRTGTGKSVCLNAVILSFLFTRKPDECRLIMIDPKKVELSEYGKVPHLMHPVVTDDKKAEAILAWAVDKMEERYELLRRARVRNIATYNDLGWDEVVRRIDPQSEEERQNLPRKMPYIVIIVDEVGDLLMSMKKEVEGHIIRLAQKSRAAGIHLILATQKPTVDVITGLIKSNLPARICFQVASRADSAVVLDEKGAEKLLGMGDMLFLQPGTSTIIRAQGAYVDDHEIARTVEELAVHEPNFESELLNLKTKDQTGGEGGSLGEKLRERDPLYEQAVEVVIREQRGSTSLLQRALGIGYGKASRFIDFMAEDGIVGAYNGSNARDVLVNTEEWAMRRANA